MAYKVHHKSTYILMVAVAIVILIGGWKIFNIISDYHSYIKSAQVNSKPGLFQPEAQMLSQAMAGPDKNAPAEPTVLARTPDHPITGGTTTPYVYDSSTCKTSATPYVCFADYYKKIVSNYGSEIAIKDVKQRYTENPVVVSQCHPIMHVIGQEASKSYSTVSEAYEHGDNFCWSGYYHGIMEGVVRRIGEKNLPTALNTICDDISGKDRYSFDYYNCVHGLGHGIMELSDDAVFDSLKMCDNLTGNWEQNSCYGGVYMENIIAADYNGSSEYLKPKDPMYPCTAVADKYKSQCYLGQSSYALEVSGYDFSKLFPMCAAIAQPYRDICNQSIGRDAANQASHVSLATKKTCSLTTNENDRIGAVKEIISYYHTNDQAKDFCNVLDDPDKTECLQVGEQYYNQL